MISVLLSVVVEWVMLVLVVLLFFMTYPALALWAIEEIVSNAINMDLIAVFVIFDKVVSCEIVMSVIEDTKMIPNLFCR